MSHSTDGSGNSRSLAPEEIEFLTGELERAWTGESNGREQVDVLIITPAQEANATVAEVFSVPRLCKLAEDAGLKSAGSYDILTGWDFRSSQKREELRDKLEIMRPRLLMLCPPCGESSPLQQFNKHHDLKNWLKQVSESRLFLRYSMQLARDQIRRGDLVVFEQPHGAKSWEDNAVVGVSKIEGVQQVVLDQCMYGLVDKQNGKPHRKRTRLMLNNEEIARNMKVLCDKSHEHQHVMGSVKTTQGWTNRSRLAQEYPRDFCRSILKGLVEDTEKRKQSHTVHCVLTVEALDTKDEKRIAALLRRCHENLGHPSTARFVAMLKAARANETCLRIAKGLTCHTCQAIQGEKKPQCGQGNQRLGLQ